MQQVPVSEGAIDKQHWSRLGFWAQVVTQFQGAINDNFFRYLIQYFVIWQLLPKGQSEPSKEVTDHVSQIANVIFAAPFILFPGIFGAISDRYSKKSVALATKYLELVIAVFGIVAFYLQSSQMLWIMLFMMLSQSAMYGPVKYGLLPETLPEDRLSWANGIIQLTTMIAVILGTVLGSSVFAMLHASGSLDRVYLAGFALAGLSILGIISAHGITRPPAANPRKKIPFNPWSGMWKDLKILYNDRWLRMTTIGYIYFWFVGALLMMNLNTHSLSTLGLTEDKNGYLLAMLSIGIGIGAVVAGYSSRGKIELGLVPIGAFGMSLFAFLLAFFATSFSSSACLLFGIGFFAGFFDVPLAATLQQRSPDEHRGSIMATTNMLTFVGIFLATPVGWLLSTMGTSSYMTFFVAGALTLAAAWIVCVMLPVVAVRSVLWILTNTIYRLDCHGRHFIPDKGGALFVANHTSFIDALAVMAATDRHVRFVMSADIFEIPWIKPIAQIMHVIPVSASGGPAKLIQSLHAATDAIRGGDVVCIFAEGQITRTGQMLPFKKGFERIMRGVEAPIVPVHLDRLWGSVFSFSEGRFFWKMPIHLPYRISISFGPPLPGNSRSADVRQACQQLGTEAYAMQQRTPLLHRAFFKAARRHPMRHAMSDMSVKKLSYGMSLVGVIAMARTLKNQIGSEKMVGLLVPPSVGGALANIAIQLLGRVAVNLNYTAAKESIESAGKQCNITHVLTSRAFLEKFPVTVPGTPVYLEDIKKQIGSSTRITSLLMAIFLPVRLIERLLGAPAGRNFNDLAAIIFSSGSAGDPKGVMLSHRNIMSNIEATLQVFPHDKNDGMVGILPFFHSFGFMGTLWLPLVEGFKVAYHPNPLDAKMVGSLVKKYKLTFLIATPTFLQTYIRRCLPEEMMTLKYVVTGAEKLPARIREAYKAKFGVEPLEGYGTTECSPAVSINIPDFKAPGFFQVGTKHGTIGHPIPGVSVRIIHPETEEPLHEGESGLLLVKGPNIMQGYLGLPEKTAEVLRDGWYNTGDIAAIDEDGFVTITDRLARFSKIAGEMVPHNKVEEVLHEVLGLTDQAMAVVGVPDDKKGEKLVVLHILTDEQLELLLSKLDECGLPNLWLPKSNAFYRIDAIPVLGTGKMDLQKAKALAKKVDLGEE